MGDLAVSLGAEYVIGADGEGAFDIALDYSPLVVQIHSDGYLESAINDVFSFCSGDYILRLDDDERVSPAMLRWLKAKQYLSGELWTFPRANLWRDERHYIANKQLYPDRQARLTTKGKAWRESSIHSPSLFGPVRDADCIIEHHKFLVRPYQDRYRIAEKYESIQHEAGLGDHYGAFSLPEDYLDEIHVKELGEGWK
jgi:glycosyltransferase involved in cell wall biosynthesis